MRREEHTAQQTVTVLLALESHSPDSGIMTQDEALLEHTIRVCAQCLWEFFRNGWQVRLCIGERRKDGLPIMSPYGGGSGMYHQLMQQLALLRLQGDRAAVPDALHARQIFHPGNTAAHHTVHGQNNGAMETALRRSGAGDGSRP